MVVWVFLFVFCKIATVALGGSVPVWVHAVVKVVDKAFSVKSCDLEFDFPSARCDPAQSRLAELWKAAGKTRGVVQGVVVEGARAGELALRGALVIRIVRDLWLHYWFKVPSHTFFSSQRCSLSNGASCWKARGASASSPARARWLFRFECCWGRSLGWISFRGLYHNSEELVTLSLNFTACVTPRCLWSAATF